MNELKILVVDDESRMRKLVKDFLTRAGYQVLEAQDGEEAVDTFYSTKGINLLVLDVMMPKMDGWEVVKEIRKVSKVPIIMLTAKDQEQDELLGFELGVDEYISKPFSPKILVARVEAILRRTVQTEGEQIEAGGIVMDVGGHHVSIDGKSINLSYKEFELLQYFMSNQGRAFTRESILNQVWNYDYFGDARTIDTHVKKLRNKLGEKVLIFIRSGEWDTNLRLKRIEKEIIKEPFSQSQDDIDADHYHDVGDLIISTDQSYYVEDIYTVKEKKTIKESYYQIQKVFQKDTVRKNDVDEIAKTYNYRF